MAALKAVLGRDSGKSRGEGGEEEAFKEFRDRTEERDGAVRGREVSGFVGFKDWEDVGFFPDGRDLGMGDGEVEDGGEVGDGTVTEVFEVSVGHAIWANGSGVFYRPNCVEGVSGSERGVGVIKLPPLNITQNLAGLLGGGMFTNT